MVVVIIIAALAGMVLPHLMPATESAKAKITTADIANISTALKMYRLHVGHYPSTDEGLDALLKPAKEYNGEPYLEKPALDPWGRKYEYRYPGSHNAGGFDLWSQGSDPQKTDDDITNWNTTGK
jgi:general secretion pathway protein G